MAPQKRFHLSVWPTDLDTMTITSQKATTSSSSKKHFYYEQEAEVECEEIVMSQVMELCRRWF